MSLPLGERARSAVLWNAGFNLFRHGLQFGVMLILVRLLDPAVYGQFALTMSIIGFIALLSFNNFIAQTLQPRHDSEVDYQLHFTAGAFFQIAAFLAANAMAFTVRAAPAYAETAPLIHAASLIFLLSWPHELRVKMLERAFDWRRLRLLHGLGLLLSAVLSVLMAVAGAGVYALVIPTLLVTAPFIYDLLVRQRWRPDWRWDGRRYAPAFRFGLALTPGGLTATLRPLLEQGLIVHALGYASAGFLTRATGLAAMFCLGPSGEILRTIYPLMTQIEPRTARYRRMSGLLLRAVVWTVVPIAAVFTILAEPVVALIYGPQWQTVVPLLPWAMLAGALSALQLTLSRLLLAHQQVRTCMIGDVLFLLGIAACLVSLLPFGLVAYIGGLCSVQTVITLLLMERLWRAGGVDMAGVALAFAPAAIAIGFSSMVAWESLALLGLSRNAATGAIMFVSVAVPLYVLTLRLLSPRQMNDLVEHLPRFTLARRTLILERPGR